MKKSLEQRVEGVERQLASVAPPRIWLLVVTDGDEPTREEVEEAKREYNAAHGEKGGIAVLFFRERDSAPAEARR